MANSHVNAGAVIALAGFLLFLLFASMDLLELAYASLLLVLVGVGVGAVAAIRAGPTRVPQTPPQMQPSLVPAGFETPIQPTAREIYKEREIIREIVKIRCRNCGTLFEEKGNRCPHCGAPP